MTFVSSIEPSLGNLLAKEDSKESNAIFDFYEFVITVVSTLLFTCGLILTIPFVRLYTGEINDADYIQPVFGTIIILAELVYCLRSPYVSVVYTTGKFRQTAKYSYAEAILNILISIILVQKYGLVGVALGTLISMIVRMLGYVHYLNQDVLYRPKIKMVRRCFWSWICILLAIVISHYSMYIECKDYFTWIIMGMITFALTSIVIGLISWLFFTKEVKLAMQYIGLVRKEN